MMGHRGIEKREGKNARKKEGKRRRGGGEKPLLQTGDYTRGVQIPANACHRRG